MQKFALKHFQVLSVLTHKTPLYELMCLHACFLLDASFLSIPDILRTQINI